MDADGHDVLIQEEETEAESGTTEESHSEHGHEESSGEAQQNCHFHAGVE